MLLINSGYRQAPFPVQSPKNIWHAQQAPDGLAAIHIWLQITSAHVLGFPCWVPGSWEWDGSQLWHRNIEIPMHWHVSNNNSIILLPDGRQWLLVLTEHWGVRTSFPFHACLTRHCWHFLGSPVVLMNNYKRSETYNFNLFYYFTLSVKVKSLCEIISLSLWGQFCLLS